MPLKYTPKFTPVEHPEDHDAPDIKAARLAQVDEFCTSAKNKSEDPDHDAACDAYAAALKAQIENDEHPNISSGWPEPS